jgi:protein-S-isoprenylcysteine O-methyltransferase Ste14
VRRPSAAAGSALFFAVAPGAVAGLVPFLLTGWEVDAEWWAPVRALGAVLVAAAAAVLVHAFARFVVEGLGTPAPVAPTEHLVVGGLYRYVRNVMYIAVTAAILGQALLLGSVALLAYAAVMWAVMAAFVKTYEEPTLARRYGARYEEYRRAVPAWWPRLSGARSPSSSPSRRGPSRRRR